MFFYVSLILTIVVAINLLPFLNNRHNILITIKKLVLREVPEEV